MLQDPFLRCRKSHLLNRKKGIKNKLSNYGEALKTLIPSIFRYMQSDKLDNFSKVINHSMSESKMGNRVSKSKWLPPRLLVKEQRADDSCLLSRVNRLRCALTDFERNYRIKIPSKLYSNRVIPNLKNKRFFLIRLIVYPY